MLQLIPVIITLAVLIFESISDIRSMKTYTLPIYVDCLINIIIKSVYKIWCGASVELVYIYMFIIVFGMCSYCSSYLVHGKLGAGDFDIIFLIFLTQPFFAVILMISIVAIFIMECMINPAKNRSSNNIISQEQTTLSKVWTVKISFVPFLLAGYVISIIFTGVVI